MKRFSRTMWLGALVCWGVPAVGAPVAQAGVLDDLRGSIASLWHQKSRTQGVARSARVQATQKTRQVVQLHDRLEDTQKVLERATNNYENYFRQMRRTEAKIVRTRAEIAEVTTRYNAHKTRFCARLTAIQRHGPPNFWPVVFSAKSLSDLSRRVEVFRTLTQHDANLQRELQSDRDELAQAHNALMAQWSERDALQKQANRERERVVVAQNRQQAVWRQINSSRQALLQYAAAQEKSSREIEGMIHSLEARKSQIVAAYEARQARQRAAQRRWAQQRIAQQRWAQQQRRSRWRGAQADAGSSRRYRRSRVRSTRSGGGFVPPSLPPMPVAPRYAPQIEVGPRYAPRVELSSYRSGGDGSFLRAGWVLPARGRLSSRFGMRYHPVARRYKLHTGDDIAAPSGTPIVAARGGRVLWAGWKKAYGNTVIVDVGGGKTMLYGHASRLGVQAGQPVRAGQHIGNVGSTGWSTGPHLHFEVRQNGRPVNPSGFLHRH